MYNIAIAAMDGKTGNPADYFDYLLPPPPIARAGARLDIQQHHAQEILAGDLVEGVAQGAGFGAVGAGDEDDAVHASSSSETSGPALTAGPSTMT